MIKGIFLDIDNTLIQSKLAYQFALNSISDVWADRYFGEVSFVENFEIYKSKVKTRLHGISTNRNRILVFKEMADSGLFFPGAKEILKLEKAYYKYFKQEIKAQLKRFQNDYERLFFNLRRLVTTKEILLLSNESLRTQLLKLSWFFPKDIKYKLLTSEELGIEKPSSALFEEGLSRIGLKANEVIMIGDSFEDDIIGARSVGMKCFHLRSIFGLNQIKESTQDGIEYIEAYNLSFVLESIS
jgi:FMN phosphatase YigB (HAD superfamily)